jgi:hypothetical protein
MEAPLERNDFIYSHPDLLHHTSKAALILFGSSAFWKKATPR